MQSPHIGYGVRYLTIAIMSLVALESCGWAQVAAKSNIATGLVFIDSNNDGRFDRGDKRFAGIRVSNGRDIVKTDGSGRYRIPVDDDDIIFVIKPRGYRTPLSADNLPEFYYIHKPDGSPDSKFAGVPPTGPLPASIDFALYKQEEPDEFKAVLFGDPQPRDQKEVDYINHDVIEGLIGTDASFGVTLGDIVFDDLKIFDPLNKSIALIGIPWYNVIGNHDLNMDARHDHQSDETFESIYGPSYYSFEYGQVHFVVLDNVEWFVPEGATQGKYVGGIGAEQMEFVRQDLELIPKEQMVVLLMHIPLNNVGNHQELFRLIEERPLCISISGHTHTHEHRFFTNEDGWRGPKPHHHIVNVTVSGSWWSGLPDDRGIPHATMTDGAPNGHSILSFKGGSYQLDYLPAGRPADDQMYIHLPEAIPLGDLSRAAATVNVYNGSEKTVVEMRIRGDNAWSDMKYTPKIDPHFQAIYDAEEKMAEQGPLWRKLSKPKPSTHLWSATLPEGIGPGTHCLEVQATDRNGRTFHAERVFRVTEP